MSDSFAATGFITARMIAWAVTMAPRSECAENDEVPYAWYWYVVSPEEKKSGRPMSSAEKKRPAGKEGVTHHRASTRSWGREVSLSLLSHNHWDDLRNECYTGPKAAGPKKNLINAAIATPSAQKRGTYILDFWPL